MNGRTIENINKGDIRIVIVGCGGLGSNVAMNLVRAGILSMELIDFDVVSESNLDRQFYFRDQVGRPKVTALKANLCRIDPHADIQCLNVRISDDNIADILSSADVVFECVDDQSVKELVTRYALVADKLVIAASGIGETNMKYPAKVRKISDKFYVVGDFATDIRTGATPMSAKVAIVAAQQADILLDILKYHT